MIHARSGWRLGSNITKYTFNTCNLPLWRIAQKNARLYIFDLFNRKFKCFIFRMLKFSPIGNNVAINKFYFGLPFGRIFLHKGLNIFFIYSIKCCKLVVIFKTSWEHVTTVNEKTLHDPPMMIYFGNLLGWVSFWFIRRRVHLKKKKPSSSIRTTKNPSVSQHWWLDIILANVIALSRSCKKPS